MLPRSSTVRSNCGLVITVSFIFRSPLCRNVAFGGMILPTNEWGKRQIAAAAGPAMGWAEWARLAGVALAELVRTRQVSAPQVTARAAAAVGRLNPKLE